MMKQKWNRVVVFSATFNNISVILLRSVLLMEETGVQTWSHTVVSSTPRHERESNSQRKIKMVVQWNNMFIIKGDELYDKTY